MFHFFIGIDRFGSWKSKFGSVNPFSRIRAALMIEIMPLAPSRWPMFDFTEPTRRGCLGDLPLLNTACMAAASIGSPTLQPISLLYVLCQIVYLCTSAMSFYKACVFCVKASCTVYRPYQVFLSSLIRDTNTVRAAVLVSTGVQYYGAYEIPSCKGVMQRLYHNTSYTLSPPITRCRTVVECEASTL